MNYFEKEYIHIKTEESIAIMQWLGLAKTEAYRTGWENFAKLIEEQNQPNWLLDFSGGKVIDIQDQKWTSEEWVPNTMDALEGKEKRLQKVAVILSSDIFNKVAVRVIMGSLEKKSGAEIAYFDDGDDAMEWLHTVENKAFVTAPETQNPEFAMSKNSDWTTKPVQEVTMNDEDDLTDDFELSDE